MIHFLLFLVILATTACAGEKLSSGEDVSGFVRRHIDNFEVMVFAKSYCPYCKATRSLFSSISKATDVNVYTIDLDEMEQEDGIKIQMELLQQTGQRTVPNVFISGEHIGGNSDLQGLHGRGELEPMLEKVVALRVYN